VTLFAPLAAAIAARSSPPPMQSATLRPAGSPLMPRYQDYSRAYKTNEIVYACIEMLATSAGEPHIVGRRWQRNSPAIRNEEQRLLAAGLSRREVYNRMIEAGFFRDLPDHPLIKLLERPNPWLSRGKMAGTIVMDRALSGNAYLMKARVQNGPMKGAVAELWRLRPDRVRIIPDAKEFIAGYEYDVGGREKISLPPEDVVHFQTRAPDDDYYGMPQLMSIAGRVDIDAYMKAFLRNFFEKGGTGPGAILSLTEKLSPENRTAVQERFKQRFGNAQAAFELMVLDQTQSSYQSLGLDRGLRDALPKELDAVTEARIAMVFGIPGSVLGLLIGYESSSYANKRQDWQVFWDLTMTPLMSALDDTLNLQLVPDFGQIDEVLFDLSNVRALQEDVDSMHDRHRKNVLAGLEAWQEGREAIGLDPGVSKGIFFIPPNTTPVERDRLAEEPEPAAPPPIRFEELPAALVRPANPLPKPHEGEDQNEFISRCMSDDEVQRDFDSQEQRLAVCFSQWREEQPNGAMAEVRHTCGKLIAKDVQGDPELFCGRCRVKFRPLALSNA
jgi:HK97 family phage portal protein